MQQIFKDQIAIPVESYPAKIDTPWRRAAVRIQTPSTAMPPDTAWSIASIDNINRVVAGPVSAGTSIITLSVGLGDVTAGNQYIIHLIRYHNIRLSINKDQLIQLFIFF